MKQSMNPKALPDELLVRHSETTELLSEVELWHLELKFFDRLLHRQTVNTGSEYGDRVAENLFLRLNHLNIELGLLHDALTTHRRSEEVMLDEVSAENRDSYLREHKECTGMAVRFSKQLKDYKRAFFEFMERYGHSITGASAED